MDAIRAVLERPSGSQAWVVEVDGEIKGSIAIVQTGESAAQLRMFGLDSSLQGHGLGKKLMTLAMDFCKDKGYRTVTLWTIEMLKPARHLYSKFGFSPTGNTKENTTWADYPMLEEEWCFEEV